jgi:hypothetical protein
MLREDVKAQNLHPSGLCGFSFTFPSYYNPSTTNTPISIIVKESETKLAILDPNIMGTVLQPRVKLWQRFKLPHSFKKHRNSVFFMHIPKTAGTSFNSFARKVYKPTEVLTHIEAYDASTFPQIAQDYLFISGHLRMDSIL